MKKISLILLAFTVQFQLNAQTQIWAAREFPKSSIGSVLASGSGISGPGKPVEGPFN